MSFLSWLFGKGNEKILERVWNFWLTLNADKIQTEGDEDKIARLSIIKEKNDKKNSS